MGLDEVFRCFKQLWEGKPVVVVLLALGFVVFAVLSAVMDNAGVGGGGVFFLLALFLCPAGFQVGIIGAVGTFATSRRAHRVPPG